MLFIGLIVAVVILAVNNNKLNKKVAEYRSILLKHGLLKEEGVSLEEEELVEVEETNEEELVPVVPIEKEKPKVIKEKPKYSDKEIKNSSILIVGSILVVLSALIFLTTTWDVTGHAFKAAMLFVMLGVFYGASAIAKKIKLNQTYKAFHYITLAYIPITLLSLCVFELIGNYLSWGGEGDTLYLAICSLIVTGIYYIDSKNKDSKLIGIFSILFLMLGIILANIYFDVRFETGLFSIALLGVIFTILHKFGKYYINESINKIGIYIIMFGILSVQLITSLIVLIVDNVIFLDVVNSFIMVYMLYYGATISKQEKAFFAVYPLLFASACLNITGLVNSTYLKEMIMLVSFILVACYDIKRFKKITDSTYYELLGCSLMLYVFTTFGEGIPPYFVLMAFLGITLAYHWKEPKSYKLYIIGILGHLLLVSVVSYYDLSMVFAGYVILVSLVLSLLYKSEFTKVLRYVGYVFMFMLTTGYEFGNLSSVILLGLFTIFTFAYSTYNNDKFNKVVSYLYLNIAALYLTKYLGFTEARDFFLIIPICNSLIFLFELLMRDDDIKFSKTILYIDFALSTVVLMSLNDQVIHLILAILNTAMFCYFCYLNNENKKYIYVPYVLAIPFVFFGHTLEFSGVNFMNIVSLGALCVFLYLMFKAKDEDNKFTIFYFIYAALSSMVFDNNKYLMLAFFALGGFVNYIVRKDKQRDFFVAVLYTCAVVFTEFLVYDFDANDISILVWGVFMIYAIALIRNIIKKYVDNFKVIEYIVFIILNLIAIAAFSSEMDGLLFVIFLVGLVIYSYIKKYGPVFLISLIFIIINVIRLTEEFWLSLPWWLYVLLIGATLIGFAVNNELKDNKNNGKLVKKIKDDLDL